MQKTILRIIWPYVLRYLAQRSADYLDQRREGKDQPVEAVKQSPAKRTAATEAVECAPARLSTTDAVWYTLSGVLLGSAIGLILANVLREEG